MSRNILLCNLCNNLCICGMFYEYHVMVQFVEKFQLNKVYTTNMFVIFICINFYISESIHLRYLRLYFQLRPSSSKNTSFCLSFCLSVTHFNYVPVIVSSWNLQELLPLTKVMSMQEAKVRGQRSRTTEVMTPFSRFRTVTPVWIHIWRWEDAQSLMLLRRGVLLFFKVTCQNFKVSRTNKSTILTIIERLRTVTPVWIQQWLWNNAQSLSYHRRGAPLFFKVIRNNFKVTRDKNLPILTRIESFRTVT